MKRRKPSNEVPRQEGPGFDRMRRRLGKEGLEAIRQDTIAQQHAMREKVGGEKIEEPRDRTTYSNYPTPLGEVRITLHEYVFLAMTPHHWGRASTKDEALSNLRRQAGSDWVRKYGFIVYLVHPKSKVDPVDGAILWPKGHKPLVIEDRQKRNKSKPR